MTSPFQPIAFEQDGKGIFDHTTWEITHNNHTGRWLRSTAANHRTIQTGTSRWVMDARNKGGGRWIEPMQGSEQERTKNMPPETQQQACGWNGKDSKQEKEMESTVDSNGTYHRWLTFGTLPWERVGENAMRRVWKRNRRTGKTLMGTYQVVSPPTDGVSSLSWSPNANLLVATSWDNQVRCDGKTLTMETERLDESRLETSADRPLLS